MMHRLTTSALQQRGRMQAMLDRYFATRGQGVNAYLVRRTRMEQVEDLLRKSDMELAMLGIRRSEIADYVFRDLFPN